MINIYVSVLRFFRIPFYIHTITEYNGKVMGFDTWKPVRNSIKLGYKKSVK